MPYILTNCSTGDVLFVRTDLEDYVDTVVTLEDYEGCWEVEFLEGTIDVVVDEQLASCKACLPTCFQSDCR